MMKHGNHTMGLSCLSGKCPMNHKNGEFFKKYKSAMPKDHLTDQSEEEIKNAALAGQLTNEEQQRLGQNIQDTGLSLGHKGANVSFRRFPKS